MKNFTSDSQKIGQLGEDVACKFLMKHDFLILERNYTKKWGEIDIIAEDVTRVTHFVEVKAVSRATLDEKVTAVEGLYRPEDNMHPNKVKRLKTTVQTYLMSVKNEDKRQEGESKGQYEKDFLWQFDLIVVYIDRSSKKMLIKPLWNIIL